MLVIVPSLDELDVDLKPECRLFKVNFTGASVDRDMEVLDPHPALTREWAEQSRQRFKDRCLPRPIRAKNVGERPKVDSGWFGTK